MIDAVDPDNDGTKPDFFSGDDTPRRESIGLAAERVYHAEKNKSR